MSKFLKKNWPVLFMAGFFVAYIAVSVGKDRCAMCVAGETFAAMVKGDESSTEPKSVNVSLQQAGWSAKTIDGQLLSAADLQGKVSIVVYWATWCRPCIKEIPHLIELRNEFSPDDLNIIAISMDSPSKELEQFAEEKGINYHVTRNNDSLDDAFGPIRYLPTIIVVDSKGEIRNTHVGAVSAKALRREALMLLETQI